MTGTALSALSGTIAEARTALKRRATSSSELVEVAYARIDDPAGEGARSFIRQFRDAAFATAFADDTRRVAENPAAPLAGLPISIKDLCDVAGSTTLAGSKALASSPPAKVDAPVVARLRRAGAVILGTTNMTEFAMGSPGTNPHYGTPANPFDRATRRIPGGSSSGAAVSVSDGMAIAALGSDTAGSVRVPAALCGLTGFKPTARRVPLDGTIPLAFSADSIGPLARSVACCATMDAILADEPDVSLAVRPLRGVRFGLPRNHVTEGLDPTVAAAFARAVSALSAVGATIETFDFAELREMAEIVAKLPIAVAEGYWWHRELVAAHGDLYDPRIARRLRAGAAIAAVDYIDFCRRRADVSARAARVTMRYDAVIMPTTHIVAPPISSIEHDDAAWLATNLTLIRNPGIANFMDRCALTIPCHVPGEAPVGFTLMGETMADRTLLAIGQEVETVLWRGRG
jgi:aspartyl-tRNA(Asn)/glutamyl-tRNA(Gln) amidotransferase subunit A